MKRLMKYWIVLICVMMLAGCSQEVVGSGKQQSASRQVAPFNQINASGQLNLQIVVGRRQQVKVHSDENLLPYIVTSVKNNVLDIHIKKGHRIEPTLTPRILINVKSLTALHLQGFIAGNVRNISGDRFALNMSGVGFIILEGVVNHAKIHLSGSGEITAKKLMVDHAVVSVAGPCGVELHVNKSLNAKIAGQGVIKYFGHPTKVTKHIAGNGRIIGVNEDVKKNSAKNS